MSARGSPEPRYGDGGKSGGFGGGLPPQPPRRAPESVSGDDVQSGTGNVTGGVVRARRRALKALSSGAAVVTRNYSVANGVQFNNLQELYQDVSSPEEVQSILEYVFELWGVPFDQPTTTKFAEDLCFGFIVAVSASDKANWDVAYDLPCAPFSRDGLKVSNVEADFKVFSDALMRTFGVTRRQFARGAANRIRLYLSEPENQHLLADVATKVGCDLQMAYLAFDGSTHCAGMTPREVQFTKTLESRNLFERDDEVARGASDRLMSSLNQGVRAIR